jgi:hypothetical protein
MTPDKKAARQTLPGVAPPPPTVRRVPESSRYRIAAPHLDRYTERPYYPKSRVKA